MRNPPLILVVDDDENFMEIITTKLKASGFETASAETAEKGIAEAARLLPDLVLMDIQLSSGPPGTEVALTIKENPETQNLKIAFLTNFKDPFPGMSGTRDEITKELGMEDFLDKTSDLDALVERVRGILERGAPAPTEQNTIAETPPPEMPAEIIPEMQSTQVPQENEQTPVPEPVAQNVDVALDPEQNTEGTAS